MRIERILWAVVVTWLLAAGCAEVKIRDDELARSPVMAGVQQENDELCRTNDLLNERVRELETRERHLAKALRRLQFLHQQQAEQLDSLAEVVRQRDAALRRVQQLEAELARLQDREGDTSP